MPLGACLAIARDDAEPFVARLHADFTTRGFDGWWDRVSMPARGLTFLHEIRDAVDAREPFLLVLGPKAATSDCVIAEWQHAVTYGKAINPVFRLCDYRLVPDELKLLHVEDFRDDTRYAFHLENLVRQLSEPVAPMGKFVGVPSLPRHLLSCDTQVRNASPEGIFRGPLGTEPNSVELQRNVAKVIGERCFVERRCSRLLQRALN